MDGRRGERGSCHPPQSLHSSCHGVSGRPRGDKPVAQCQKKGEKGGGGALPSQGRQAHSLGGGLFSPLPKLAPLAIASHPPSFTNHRRQVHAQHAQRRRGRSPSSPRLLHHALLFFEVENHGRRQVPLRTAGADRRACACDGADDGRPDFARRVPRSWPSIAPNAARPSCRLGDQLTNTSSPHRIHQGRRQAHLREPPYILPRRRARTDTRHPARAAAGRTILLVAGRGHVGDVGRLLALHG